MALVGALFGTIAIAGRTCVGLVFLLAAAQKLAHWRLLPGVMADYRLLPGWAIAPLAALLPPLELLLASALLLGQLRPWCALAGIALLMLFAAAMARNVMRGRHHIDCGCGQDFLAQRLSWALIARNLVLVALLLPSLAAYAPLPLANILTGAAAGLGFLLVYLLFNLLSARPATGARRFA